MKFLEEIFQNFFNTKKNYYEQQARANAYRNTIGKVEGHIYNKEAEMDQKILAAQRKAIDKATMNKQGGGGGKQQNKKGGKPPKGKGSGNMGLFGDGKNSQKGRRPPQGRPPQGRPQQGRGPGQYQDPNWDPPQQQGYGGFNQGSQEKTQAIDIRGLEKEQEKQVVGWIVAINGPHRGTDFRLFSGKNVVGTAADCDVVITDPYLSARHCTVRYESGNFVVIDLDSRNGTYVNQKKISKEDLIDNDTLRLGKSEFKFKSLY